jgi:hypothetical protein
MDAIAHPQLRGRWVGYPSGYFVQYAGHQHIVAVYPKQYIAGGTGKTLVQRIGLSAIGAALPIAELRGVPLNDLRRSIAAAAIHNEVLQQRILLPQYTQDGFFEKRRLIERWRDNRDAGKGQVIENLNEQITIHWRQNVYLQKWHQPA